MSSVFDPRRSLRKRRQAVVNLLDFLVRGGLADTTRTPSEVIDEGRTRTLLRYVADPEVDRRVLPVLLVPPLGSQAVCFDLRKGASLAEHLVASGRPTYLVDYGPMSFAERGLGLEHWINDVLPPAIRAVSDDAGGQPVDLVGWCMGGLFSLGATAVHDELPIHSVAMVASPFDMSKNPMLAPVRAIGKLTGGRLVRGALRVTGGSPAKVTGLGFKATALPTYVKKPVTIWKRRDDREFLGQVQAVDALMNDMLSYPGRAMLQAYSILVQDNALASGRVQGPNRVVDLADVRVPVMNVAGTSDVLAPKAAVHHVGSLLPNSPDVRLPEAPGGHLGVLTGTSARATTWAYLDEFLDDHAP
jgi:polyhydroxyalkanoate synthase